jgi:hypothetical protein
MPDAVTLYRLAQYYGKPIDFMYGDDSSLNEE